ncbi:uncharacterized protein LOC117123791 [Anneissia japonica]|uniref:uncharacterized protein LOC117123791 n=1 Tax=Anneissia japonica TaxID=1529436 RepID=UPI0014257F6E|nr:uncharacterized protein LOC117123791 [Anneissia japonica]
MYCACKILSSAVGGGHSGKYLKLGSGRKVYCTDVEKRCRRKRLGKRIFTPAENWESYIEESEASWQNPNVGLYESRNSIPFESNEQLYSERSSLKEIIRMILRKSNLNYYDTDRL